MATNTQVNKKTLLNMVWAIIGLLLFACSSGEGGAGGKDELVVIHTEFGDMTVLLYEETPLHKQNFLKLAREGRYDSTIWHRIIEGFMVQGGDVFLKEGTSDTEEQRIPAEIVEGFYHTKGALAAARQGDRVNPNKESSSCQFYIVQGKKIKEEELTIDQMKLRQGINELFQLPGYDTLQQYFVKLARERRNEETMQLAFSLKDAIEKEVGMKVTKDIDPEVVKLYSTEGGAPHLDGGYTTFGRVVEGLDVIDKLAAVPTQPGDKPVKDTYMTMEVVKMKKRKVTKDYNYEYPEGS